MLMGARPSAWRRLQTLRRQRVNLMSAGDVDARVAREQQRVDVGLAGGRRDFLLIASRPSRTVAAAGQRMREIDIQRRRRSDAMAAR